MNENIKNIAEIIYENKNCFEDTCEWCGDSCPEIVNTATALDKLGYRKQSDTVEEFEKFINSTIAARPEAEKWYNFQANFVAILPFLEFLTNTEYKTVKKSDGSWSVVPAEQYGKEEK